MAITISVYGKALDHLADADIDWLADDIRVALLASTYTFDQDAHDFFDDVSADEVSGTGYTAGGVALANKARTYDAANNRLTLDADDVEWLTSTITARYAVIYKKRGGASSADELVALVDFGGNQTTSGTRFSITWHANGILRLTL